MFANTYPGRDESAGQDKTVDIGFDSQYQYFSKTSDVTVLASWLHEQNNLDATEKLGSASNSTDHLSTTSLTASYLYDKTIGPNIQYFRIDGDKDALLYADNRTASPNSDGLLFQLDYLPFNRDGGPDFWPKSNLKLSLQYILYNRFDGATRNYDGNGRDARDNNTTYLEAWLAF